jgi:hypothetical protein
MIRAKYLHHEGIKNVKHRLDSPVWTDLLKVRQFYLRGRRIET